jgi:hypothetical protein
MAATTSDPIADEEVLRRHNRLASSMQDLRTRAGGADKARVLLVMGGVLIPLGIVLILLGWSGVSHTTDTFEQTPYVVSGGLLGLALVVAGGFCYFGYWQTQAVRAVRRDAADIRSIRDSLQHIEELLAANPELTGNGATPESAPSTARRRKSAAGT